MKKILITLLIMSVALTSIFAVDGLKVGGEVGYTSFGISLKADDAKLTVGVNGFTFAGVAEYKVADGVDVVGKLGLDIHGKPHTTFTYAGNTIKNTEDDAVPVHFTAYVGGKYTYAINDQFSAYAGLGFDFALGKLDKDDDKVSAFFGVKAEIAGKYQINDKFAVTLGGGFTWIFADTDEDLKTMKDNVKDSGGSWFEHRFRVTAGVTYSL